MECIKIFITRLLLCMPFALILAWVIPEQPDRQISKHPIQTVPTTDEKNPWAAMPDEELPLGDAEVAR